MSEEGNASPSYIGSNPVLLNGSNSPVISEEASQRFFRSQQRPVPGRVGPHALEQLPPSGSIFTPSTVISGIKVYPALSAEAAQPAQVAQTPQAQPVSTLPPRASSRAPSSRSAGIAIQPLPPPPINLSGSSVAPISQTPHNLAFPRSPITLQQYWEKETATPTLHEELPKAEIPYKYGGKRLRAKSRKTKKAKKAKKAKAKKSRKHLLR